MDLHSVFLGPWEFLRKRRAWSRDAPSPHKLGILPHKSSCRMVHSVKRLDPRLSGCTLMAGTEALASPTDTLRCQCFPSSQPAPHCLPPAQTKYLERSWILLFTKPLLQALCKLYVLGVHFSRPHLPLHPGHHYPTGTAVWFPRLHSSHCTICFSHSCMLIFKNVHWIM